MEIEWHHFLYVNGKKNCRDNTKRREKPYFHCGPQAEKAIKSNQYYLQKEMLEIETVIIVIITKYFMPFRLISGIIHPR